MVRYSVTQPGSGYDFVTNTGTTIAMLDFDEGKTSADLQIDITNDGRVENDGIVRVTLLPDDRDTKKYTVSSVNGANVGEVFVTDNDTAPELTLVAPEGPTNEGLGIVTFMITSTVDLGQSFKVRYDPSEVLIDETDPSLGTYDFLNGSATPSENQEDIAIQVINFHKSPSGSGYVAPFWIPIDNDDVGEATGEVQVELLAG